MSLRPVAFLIASVVMASSAFAQQSAQSSASTASLDHGAMAGRHAPEIDAALTAAAVALVLGGLFIFTTARRKKLAAP